MVMRGKLAKQIKRWSLVLANKTGKNRNKIEKVMKQQWNLTPRSERGKLREDTNQRLGLVDRRKNTMVVSDELQAVE